MNATSHSDAAVLPPRLISKPDVFRINRQLENAAALLRLGETNLANRLAKCALERERWINDQKNQSVYQPSQCGLRFCEFCYWRTSKETRRQYIHRLVYCVNQGFRLLDLTLTIPNISQIGRTDYDCLFACFRDFLSRNEIRECFIGTLIKLETTFNENSQEYHPHLHCLMVYQKCVPYQIIREVWGEVTFSFTRSLDERDIPGAYLFYRSVKVEKIKVDYTSVAALQREVKKRVNYLCKYNHIFDPDAFAHCALATIRKPLIRSYGILRGKSARMISGTKPLS